MCQNNFGFWILNHCLGREKNSTLPCTLIHPTATKWSHWEVCSLDLNACIGKLHCMCVLIPTHLYTAVSRMYCSTWLSGCVLCFNHSLCEMAFSSDIGLSIKKEQDVTMLPISIWLYSVQYVVQLLCCVQLLPYLVMSDHERKNHWRFVVGLVGVTLMTPTMSVELSSRTFWHTWLWFRGNQWRLVFPVLR